MSPVVEGLFWTGLKLLFVASGIFYIGLVILAYRNNAGSYQFTAAWDHAGRTAERFLVWLGVKSAAVLLAASRAVLNALFEASAEIGEWYFRRRGVDVEDYLRSRFS